MKAISQRQFFIACVAIYCLGAIYFAASSGIFAAVSFSVGTLTTAAHLLSMKALLAHGAKVFADPNREVKPTMGAIFVVFSSLATLPILVIVGYALQTVSQNAIPTFLWGLGLVYFALVGSAIIQR